MKIGLVQAAAGCNSFDNLETLRRYAESAAHASCQVVCFPECFLTGYSPEEAEMRSVSVDAPVLKQVSQMAAEYDLDILVGFMEKRGDAYYITHGIFRTDGRNSYYRKTHLGSREKRFFTPGDVLEVFSLTNGVKIGVQICVETHYPEVAQTLALRGAEVIFAPHAVPRVSGDRQAIWSKYIPARSYDNRIYMACCNLWDTERFGGGCLLTGPRGDVEEACYEDKECLLVCEIDRELLTYFRNSEEKRSAHFYPSLRRKELYE